MRTAREGGGHRAMNEDSPSVSTRRSVNDNPREPFAPELSEATHEYAFEARAWI